MTLTQINADNEYQTCPICGEFKLLERSVYDRSERLWIPGWICEGCKSEFTGTISTDPMIDVTDVSAGTYYKVIKIRNLRNIVIQYKLIAGIDNTIELQFWGTVYIDAEGSTDDDWADITEFLSEEETLSVTNDSIQDMAITDSNVSLAKIKIKYIVSADTPDNSIKIGWNSDK